MNEPEVPLTGGNVSAGVVRVGETVRRPAGPWTPAVHALLRHLHASGFRAAPLPLGIDERGREILTHAPGTTLWPDRMDVLAPPDRLARVARLIRAFHDAAETFTPPPDAAWQRLLPVLDDGPTLVGHHDIAPWNLVADGPSGAWTLIDWDGAGPTTRLWDLAYACAGFVRLTGAAPFARPDEETAARLRTFADAYGLDGPRRRALVPLLGRRVRGMYDFLLERAALGERPWADHWRDGHGDAWRGDAEYIEAREDLWTRALLA
ncbi:aminoglycoside phosphotransferase family protein [Streptomyces avicenniae]|uniref:phosphotransferase n=1 Tax=Streptomyces avicenniae TaxID=500153 RepID=UPI0006998687|nr:aminoglycoside phosphotransferase family protein [Streptomyces avicenniae]